jgi:para-nitrobenzyl esterase
LSTVVTDWAWGCPVLGRDRALSAHVPLYVYEFGDEKAPWFTTLPKPNFPTGAFHGAELQYLFNDEQLPGPQTAAQRRLSAQMISYWSQFAYTGTPNGGGQPLRLPFQAAGTSSRWLRTQPDQPISAANTSMPSGPLSAIDHNDTTR